MASEIILYDIPSQGPHRKCWSLNPWKARLALNYKGVPYKTEWLEYPDIAGTLKSYGIPKNDESVSQAEYSCPAAKFPDGTYMMDSRKIAETLEKLQPEPSLHMDRTDYIDRAQAAVLGCRNHLGPIGIPRIPDMLLSPRSAEYFHETRRARFGMSLAEVAKSDKAGENAWKNAEPSIQKLQEILHENAGPYVLGEEPSFADFIIAGFWAFAKKLDVDGDLFERGMKYDGSFPAHYRACERWLQRDD